MALQTNTTQSVSSYSHSCSSKSYWHMLCVGSVCLTVFFGWIPLTLSESPDRIESVLTELCEEYETTKALLKEEDVDITQGTEEQVATQKLCQHDGVLSQMVLNAFRRRIARIASRKNLDVSDPNVFHERFLTAQLIDMRAALEKKKVNPYNKIGVYFTASRTANTEFFDSTLDQLLEHNGSTFVFDVKGSFVYFHTESEKAEELGMVRPLYELPEIIQKAKDKGLYTIARYIAIKDEVLVQKHPELGVRHPRTGNLIGLGWIDPDNPSALEYNRQVMIDLVKSGIDEVNLDYIRYSTALPSILNQMNGQEKADKLEVYIRMVRDVIDEYGPETKLGLSTFAILGWNYEVNLEPLGQDVVRFAHMVDVISPMAYPQTFSEGTYYNPAKHPRSRSYWLVYRTLTGYAELLGEEHMHKIRPWLQGYFITTRSMLDQMDAVIDSGSCGFTIWNANNNYGTFYRALESWQQPEHCLDGSNA